MEPELQHPTLHTDQLSAREREVVAAVLEDRLRSLFESALYADDDTWAVMTAEVRDEEVAGQGLIRSRLGMIQVLRRVLGAPAVEFGDIDLLRRVGE